MEFLVSLILDPIKSALSWLLAHPLELLILALLLACGFLYWRNDVIKTDLLAS